MGACARSDIVSAPEGRWGSRRAGDAEETNSIGRTGTAVCRNEAKLHDPNGAQRQLLGAGSAKPRRRSTYCGRGSDWEGALLRCARPLVCRQGRRRCEHTGRSRKGRPAAVVHSDWQRCKRQGGMFSLEVRRVWREKRRGEGGRRRRRERERERTRRGLSSSPALWGRPLCAGRWACGRRAK